MIDLKLNRALETNNQVWQKTLKDICKNYDKRIETYSVDLDESNDKVLVLASNLSQVQESMDVQFTKVTTASNELLDIVGVGVGNLHLR